MLGDDGYRQLLSAPVTSLRQYFASMQTEVSAHTSETPCVVFWFSSGQYYLQLALARHFRQRHGLETILIGACGDDLRYVTGLTEFSEVVALDAYCEAHWEERAEIDEFATARNNERTHGLNFVQGYRSDRSAGRGFISTSWFPKSRNLYAADYASALKYFNILVDYFSKLLESRNIVSLSVFPGSIAQRTLYDMARHNGVPIRNLTFWRSSDTYFWAYDQHDVPADFRSILRQALRSKYNTVPSVALCLPSEGDALYQASDTSIAFDERRLSDLVRGFYVEIRRRLGDLVRKRRRGLIRRYELAGSLRLIWEMWRWRRRMDREGRDKALLPVGSYVYYPLHVEPESSLSVENDTVVSQSSVIEWLAAALPAGWTLIVKEHPFQHAPRYRAFRRQLVNLPNVLVASASVSSARMIAGAATVATINGTVGYEAALAGKPVIFFDRLAPLADLAHVFVATSYQETCRHLRRIADDGVDPEACAHSVAALAACWNDVGISIPADEFNAACREGAHPGSKIVETLAVSLLASIDFHKPDSFTTNGDAARPAE